MRLTVAQALVRFLANQYSERDGVRQRLVPGCFGIFGHGNVAGVGQALLQAEQTGEADLRYHMARNEQAMVHASVGFAKMRNRLQTMACTASIGPGSTNMVTGAALATINRIPVLLLHDDSYADIFRNLVTVGTITGRRDAALALVARLRARTNALVRSVKPRKRKPSVFVVLGNAPVFTVGKGSYIADLVDMAGGRNAAADVNAPYARYSAEALVARQPDLLVVDPDVHLDDVLNQPPWNALRAVKQHRVYTLPDAAILERPGPRYNDGLAWLITTFARASH